MVLNFEIHEKTKIKTSAILLIRGIDQDYKHKYQPKKVTFYTFLNSSLFYFRFSLYMQRSQIFC